MSDNKYTVLITNMVNVITLQVAGNMEEEIHIIIG